MDAGSGIREVIFHDTVRARSSIEDKRESREVKLGETPRAAARCREVPTLQRENRA